VSSSSGRYASQTLCRNPKGKPPKRFGSRGKGHVTFNFLIKLIFSQAARDPNASHLPFGFRFRFAPRGMTAGGEKIFLNFQLSIFNFQLLLSFPKKIAIFPDKSSFSFFTIGERCDIINLYVKNQF